MLIRYPRGGAEEAEPEGGEEEREDQGQEEARGALDYVSIADFLGWA